MATYRYKAKKGPETVVSGEVVAAGREEAVEKITQMGYVPVRIDEYSGHTVGVGGIRFHQITVFCRQLSVLLRSGVPILKALTILYEQSNHAAMRRLLAEIRNDIKEGTPLSASMARFPRSFGQLVIAMVKAGESGGMLQEMLARLAAYRHAQERTQAKVRAVLMYPLLMSLVGTATILFMLIFVLPKLTGLFERLGQRLPPLTRAIIALGELVSHPAFWLVVVVVGVLSGATAMIVGRSERGQWAMARMQLTVPLWGRFLYRVDMARFSRTLALLLKSGIPFVTALQNSVFTLNNAVLRQSVARGIQVIEQGGAFTDVLRRQPIFPSMLVNLVRVGEESGNLEEALTEVAAVYEEETEEMLATMTNLLEPVLILVMGLIVGLIIAAMLWPVFELNLMVS